MAFSTLVSLFWVATVFCLIVNAFEEKLPLPAYSSGDRQSKQMFAMPPPLYNYFNPYYGAPILIPATAHDQIQPEFFSGDSRSELMARFITKTEDISITPADTECRFLSNSVSSCIKSSTALSGTLNVQFTNGGLQLAMVSIAPNKFFYSRVKITCTEVSPSLYVFMKSGDANKPSSFSGPFTTTELKPVQMLLTSTSATDKLKCSWSSSF